MAATQMALPVDRRNGASAPTAAPPLVPPAPVAADLPPATVGVPVWVRRVTTASVLAVAAVAAVASYEHMRALAELAGEGWRSWLLPISVDGLAVAASMTMLVRRRSGQSAGFLPWVALLLGLGTSLAANVAAADPTGVGRLVAAWPPVGLLLSYELLLQQTNHGTRGGPGVHTAHPGAVQPPRWRQPAMTDTMTTAPVPAHVLGVVSDGYEYLVECSCGWASGWHGTPDEADFEGGEHRDSAVGAADHMDVLMSGLLDLQDDIAAVVVWLAEYWSVDLPRLGWSACGDDRDDRRALRVLGYADPGELAAAAAVLGATPADDPVNDGGRTRYRHVKRDFGRVQIDVFTSLTRAQAAETAL